MSFLSLPFELLHLIQEFCGYEELYALTLVNRDSHALFQSCLDSHRSNVQKYRNVTVATRSNLVREPEQAIFTGALSMLHKISDDKSLLPYVKKLKLHGYLGLSWSQTRDSPVSDETLKYNSNKKFGFKSVVNLHLELWPELFPEILPSVNTEASRAWLSSCLEHDQDVCSMILLMLTLPELRHIELSNSQRHVFKKTCIELENFDHRRFQIVRPKVLQNLTRLTIHFTAEETSNLSDLVLVLSLPNLQTLECHDIVAEPTEKLDRFSRHPWTRSWPARPPQELADGCLYRPGHHTVRHVSFLNSDIYPWGLWSLVRLLRGLESLEMDFGSSRCADIVLNEQELLCEYYRSFLDIYSASRPSMPHWRRYHRAFYHAACDDDEKTDLCMTFGFNSRDREFLKLERQTSQQSH